MIFWVGGAVLLAVLLHAALRWFARAQPGDLAHALRTFAAVFSALASTGLVFAGRWGFALITVAATGMAIRSLVTAGRGAAPLGGAAGGQPPPHAAVETSLLRMELDRASGQVDGLVRAGVHAGQRLSRLGLPALLDLLAQARRDDPPSADLLLAYLDRSRPDWRTQRAGKAASQPAQAMDRATALEVLGLPADASPEAIRAAHRTLMARLHPDHGGSTYLASQINQARDVLLGRRQAG